MKPSKTLHSQTKKYSPDAAQRTNEYAEWSCRSHSGFEDVIQICEQTSLSSEGIPADEPHDGDIGWVYLIKSGKHYKIGKTNSLGRRGYELAIQLPEKATTVHSIKTDDPTGIEAYWHKRFETKRANGEWFKLEGTDISAVKRRRLM